MMLLRKLHLYIGIILALFLLLQAVTGFLLRLRLSGPVSHLLHTWLKYAQSGKGLGLVIGVILSVGLAWLAVSGAMLFINMRLQKAKRAKRRKEQAGAG